MTSIEATVMTVAFMAVAISAVTDIRTRKIKNWVTMPAILLGLLVHVLGGGWDSGDGVGLKWSLIGLVIGALPFLAMNTIDSRAFGMGDVKLMAAVGALLAWPLMLDVLFYVAMAGGIVALVILLRKRMLRETISGMLNRRSPDEPARGGAAEPLYIPYGVAIAAGTSAVVTLEVLRHL